MEKDKFTYESLSSICSIGKRNNNNIKINITKFSAIKDNKKFFIVTNLKNNSFLDKIDNMNKLL